MQNHESYDEKVEIVDLETQDGVSSPSRQGRLARMAHHLLQERAARAKVMTLALVCSIVILLVVLQSSFHFGLRIPATPVAPKPPEAIVDMSTANGTVYIVERDGTLTARQVADGAVRWQIKPSTEIYHFPVASGQMVYRVAERHKEGVVEARRASDGELVWNSSIPSPGPLPLIAQGGVVYVNTQGGIVYAFDGRTGKPLWHFASGQPVPMYGFLTAFHDSVLIRTKDNMVFLLQALSGKEILHFQQDTQTGWWFQEDRGIFYNVSYNNLIQAFSTKTGKLLWHSTFVGEDISSLKVSNGVAYIGTSNGFMALRGLDGKTLWRNASLVNPSVIVSIENNILYLFPSNDMMVGIRASDGTVLWQHQRDELKGNNQWVDVTNGVLCLIQSDNFMLKETHTSIQCWNSNAGKVLWHYSPSAPIFLYPREIDGILCLRFTDGTMDVIRLSDGVRLWHYAM